VKEIQHETRREGDQEKEGLGLRKKRIDLNTYV
jgi:hypothetical protein